MSNETSSIDLSKVGIVVIGRNEGERLKRCLESLKQYIEQVVYVDSGSSDGSVEHANSIGCTVVELDMSTPFTAARARNEGAHKLISANPNIEYIQFVDGDCEVTPGWIQSASKYLKSNITLAAVFGVLEEKYKYKTVYNMLCAMEWNTPKGKVDSTGGIFMLKAEVFKAVGGFNPALICGEEPELCKRILECGHEIEKIDESMASHDANILKFSQWWKRAKRSGYAYTSAADLDADKSIFQNKKLLSIMIWGCLLPLLIIMTSVMTPLFLILFLIYPVQILKIVNALKKVRNEDVSELRAYASFLVLGKFPEFIGVIQYLIKKVKGSQHVLIEYK